MDWVGCAWVRVGERVVGSVASDCGNAGEVRLNGGCCWLLHWEVLRCLSRQASPLIIGHRSTRRRLGPEAHPLPLQHRHLRCFVLLWSAALSRTLPCFACALFALRLPHAESRAHDMV